MHCLTLRLSAAFAVLLTLPAVGADEATSQELKELRQALQQQTKQIELLAEQVGRLTRALQAQEKGPEVATPTTGAATTSVTPNTLTPKPLPPLPDLNVPPPTPQPPRTEAVPTAEAVTGTKHTVAKGETLTSIAKQYNIPLNDLKNANKIENDRKLQIGQILSIPTPKSPETPEKKEN
jgi:LysM repeat protein